MTKPRPTSAANRWSIATFSAATLIGAFLLFQVQPLVSKNILPWFGGCPSVWTTCMLFFQTLLFGGYLYAHLLQRWLAPRNQVIAHLALVAAALAMLPILPGQEYKPIDSSNPTWRILWLLLATVGLPYLALSATSPLVQAWFSIRCPDRSPYRLYALSNFGSLAALLTYPFVFEPSLDLPTQATLWSAAFVAYAALCAVCLAWLWKSSVSPLALEEGPGVRAASSPTNGTTSSRKNPHPNPLPKGEGTAFPQKGDGTSVTMLHRLCWLLLPACASLMLLAATNHICQDVASVPFLWVVPLSLYLLSFIICFDHERWYLRRFWAAGCLLLLAGVVAYEYARTGHSIGLKWELLLNGSALFFVCMVCHGELARRKPQPRYLTEFYLVIAAGGALGGLFVALIAPLIFSSYLEWQFGVVAAALLAAGLLLLPGRAGRRGITYYVIIAPVVAMIVSYTFFWGFDPVPAVDRARNFFGVVTVRDETSDAPQRRERTLVHGRITHGRQSSDPVKRHWPTAYYGQRSGVVAAMAYLHKSGPIRVGAIGLGIGTVAAYAEPGDVFRFYEINPAVLDIANRHFTYLSDCRGKSDVVLGDARLSLENEPPQNFDLLVVDAFSSDSIPTHLLTREAMDLYRSHLTPGGVIAFHISNTYLDLAPVVRALANDAGMTPVLIASAGDEDRLCYNNTWMLVTDNVGFLKLHHSEISDASTGGRLVPLWTDQFSNLFQILSKGM